ncbi:nitrate/nitrite transporter [Actinomadura hibisca]|uniref:nitrate/nitrite transporter n=1 Tax=Actinomadura hibisca TaxID=68565 RepID=UPI0008325374|nr:MFS transporter [Actinomadura hibisca]
MDGGAPGPEAGRTSGGTAGGTGGSTAGNTAAGAAGTTGRGAGFNLALATWTFAINFWAWNLVGPLSAAYARDLRLSPFQTSMLVAIPVLVGSVGRIPVGALTDRYGGRLMFAAVSFLSILPVLYVAFFGSSYGSMLFGGFVLGIAGTAFAIGIPFCNAWYDRSRRGFATGVFGAGMGGTALSAFFTPRLADGIGRVPAHLVIAAALAATGVLVLLAARDAPGWRPSSDPVLPRLRDALRIRTTWSTSLLYALAFGGFVAFSTYLPTYLKNVYDFDAIDAGMRAAGFSLAAVVARPLGGVLSDRIGPRTVLMVSFGLAAVMALVVSLEPAPELGAGLSFVLLAFALGLGTGGVFALIGQQVPQEKVGSVTGLVGAAGGLGGYFPPLLMGAVYGASGSYFVGLLLLACAALAALLFTALAFRPRPAGRTRAPDAGDRRASSDGARRR